ncbi:MAG: asparagine synthase-related protein, partial [Candidatus Wallbacteria bacterium]|nr:asparagine synthase-related protein [Candidatus Wallbacteria bacterium]
MKILAAMSGGVDSSVAALLLKQSGHAVTGITFKMWEENSRCCNLSDIRDAAAAARKIGIKHHS